MLGAKQECGMVKVEFYKMAVGGGVGRLLETVTVAPFANKKAFISWAQSALPDRRGDQKVWEWPEAVRVVDGAGAELFHWTLWDQINAGKPLINVNRT